MEQKQYPLTESNERQTRRQIIDQRCIEMLAIRLVAQPAEELTARLEAYATELRTA